MGYWPRGFFPRARIASQCRRETVPAPIQDPPCPGLEYIGLQVLALGYCAVLSGVLAFSCSLYAADASLQGRVVDENNAAVAAAKISLIPSGPEAANSSGLRALAGPTGSFSFSSLEPGRYVITAESNEFFVLKDYPADIHDGTNEILLVLNRIHNTSETVNVQGTTSPVDIEQTSSERQLNGHQIMEVPYPSTHDLRNALKLMPGVVRGPNGELHFNGGQEKQVLYTLDGFNISNPLTNTFSTHLSVESVRSLTYSSGRYSPEFGKGSAGALAIRTETGDDTLRYSATNFIPGIDTKRGPHIGAWTPRFNLSGPIWKGRAWFADSLDANRNTLVIEDLPKGHDRTTSTSFSNLLHGQVNLTPGNILFTDFLVNYLYAPNTGLGALDPLSTTTDRRFRSYFTSVKDQIYLARGTLLEIGFADNRTFGRQIPQGEGLYVFMPLGHRGYYYADSRQESERKQFLSNLFLPSFQLAGTHQLKVGVDFDRLGYSQDIRRTGFENLDLAGRVIRKTTFGGSGALSRPSLEASSYFVDAWRLRPNLQVEAGMRQDWDELVRRFVFSPRVSASYAPLGWKNTKLAAGYAVVYDATAPQLFAQALDQYSVTTIYNTDGNVIHGPAVSLFTIANRHLKAPRYQNWSLGAEQRLPRRIQLGVNLLRKRGTNGFTFANTLSPGSTRSFAGLPLDGIFNLTNLRKDVYDSAEITVHQAFGGLYEWFGSYTRSRALSNAVLNIAVDQTAVIGNNEGRLPWDSPNRFLSWGYLPTPWKNWAIAYLFETRDGFPFSIQQVDGTVVGQPDSKRLPFYFSLNLHAERTFHLQRYRFALRGGFNNITDHKNPATAINTIGSPQFLTYYGSEGRHFVFRFRWLGKD